MVHKAYENMIDVFNFTTIEAAQSADIQQRRVRKIVGQKIDLPAFKLKIRSKS